MVHRHTPRRAAFALLLALLAVVAIPLGAGPVGATVERSASYPGPAYGPGLRHSPTATKTQSKVWWHDGAWWGLMFGDDTTVRIYELRPDHTWRRTNAVVTRRTPSSVGDVLPDGDTVHVLFRTADGLQVDTMSYDRKRRTYASEPGFPVVVAKAGSDTASLAKDSRGRLWTSFITNGSVRVTRSSTSGRTWLPPFVPNVPGTTLRHGEIVSTVAIDRSIGLMWSDQRVGAFRLALHKDSAPDSAWRVETAAQGPALADDHINLHVVPGKGGSTLLAAVKTSNGDHGEPDDSPLIMVLERAPDGRWSRHVVGTVGDQETRPLLAVDTERNVYVIGKVGPDIVYKVAPLNALEFRSGPGTSLMSSKGSSYTDPSGTAQTVDRATGIVVLVSDENEHRYWHAEIAIDAPVDRSSAGDVEVDKQPPTAPSAVKSQLLDGSVRLTWTASSDGTHWSAASDAAEVAEYAVFRDGVKVGTSTSTSFTDSPEQASTYTYTVLAVDPSGNTSPSSGALRVKVTSASSGSGLPSLPSVPRSMAIPGALALAAVCALLVFWVRTRLVTSPRRDIDRLSHTSRTIPVVPAPQGKHARKPTR